MKALLAVALLAAPLTPATAFAIANLDGEIQVWSIDHVKHLERLR